ncbi:MAG: hypothetical protein HC896_10880 [Bacteroidales bacterium]|nr:hypothetical protein [Bacteroidales bacterium]
MQTFTFIGFIACTVLSCNKENQCALFPGDYKTENRDVDFFNQLVIDGVCIIHLTQDTANKMAIRSKEKTLRNIKTFVSDSILFIENHNYCSWANNYEKPVIWLHVKQLNNIKLYESCKILSTNPLKENIMIEAVSQYAEINLILDNNGMYFYNNRGTTGIYEFSGFSRYPNLNVHFGSWLKADSLSSEFCVLRNEAITDTYLGETKGLIVKIENTGNVYYTGSPEVIELNDSLSKGGRLIHY